jgi:hypothetical protein
MGLLKTHSIVLNIFRGRRTIGQLRKRSGREVIKERLSMSGNKSGSDGGGDI